MIIIKPSKRCVDHKYFLDYDWKDEPGSGFSFPCDKHGNLIMDEMTEAREVESMMQSLKGLLNTLIGIQNLQ